MLDDEVIVELAPAKLNLALHVRRRRADGYHELETLFAFARDGDVVTIARAGEDSLSVTGPFAGSLLHPHPSAAVAAPSLSRGEREQLARGERKGEGDAPNDNLVLRALRGFREAVGADAPLAITLEKNLPVASGLGGGSADAAATLRALAPMHGIASDDPALVAVARGLGADVAPCLVGRTARGTGRGDELTLLALLGDVPALLVNPGVATPTGPVFAGWDGVDRGALGEGDPLAAARAGRNDLTAPALALAPVIGDVLALLEAQPGATLVRMSGSGATCFALFRDVAARRAAARAVALAHPGWWRLETMLA